MKLSKDLHCVEWLEILDMVSVDELLNVLDEILHVLECPEVDEFLHLLDCLEVDEFLHLLDCREWSASSGGLLGPQLEGR